MNQFRYKRIKSKKYKYELLEDYEVLTGVWTGAGVRGRFYSINHVGHLVIKKGYRWDGASGPTYDSKSTMRASCVHDVFYQMFRLRQLSLRFRKAADKVLRRFMIEDASHKGGLLGTWSRFRAGYYYRAVRLFGGSHAKPRGKHA